MDVVDARPGPHRRERRRRRRHGARARAVRHPLGRRRGPHVAIPTMIEGIQEAVTIPVMAKARIGHFVEAQVLEALEVDYVDESEVLTPADEANHIDKWRFTRAVRLRGHQPRRGAAPHRRGRRDDPHEGRGGHRQRRRGRPPHARHPRRDPAPGARSTRPSCTARPRSSAPRSTSCAQVAETGRLPVVNFSAGRHRHAGRRRADDAARRRGRLRRLGHLQVRGPRAHRRSPIVEATTHFEDPARVARASAGSGAAMAGIEIASSASRGSSSTAAGSHRSAVGRRRARPPGRLRGARARARRARGRAARRAHARRPRGPRRARHARRRVHDDDASGSSARAWPSRCATSCEPARPVLGTCAGLIMLDREHLGLLDVLRPPQRLRPPGARRFETDLAVRGFDGAPVRAVFIRAPWVDEHGAGRGGARRGGRAPGRRAPGQRAGRGLPPRDQPARRACTPGCSSASVSGSAA